MTEQRCRMYRLRPDHHVPVHEPRACCHCWVSCRGLAQEGAQWCAECEAAAADSDDLRVIVWLDDLTEPPTTPDELVDHLMGA